MQRVEVFRGLLVVSIDGVGSGTAGNEDLNDRESVEIELIVEIVPVVVIGCCPGEGGFFTSFPRSRKQK